MEFKRLFIVLLISFMLLSVPCAYASDSNTDENVNNNSQGVKINPVAKAAIVSFNSVIKSGSLDSWRDESDIYVDKNALNKKIMECESKLDKITIYIDTHDNIPSIIDRDYKRIRIALDDAKKYLSEGNIDKAERSVRDAKTDIYMLNRLLKL